MLKKLILSKNILIRFVSNSRKLSSKLKKTNYPSETLIRQFIILRCVNLKFSRGVLLFNAFFGKTLVRQSCAWRREHVFCCCPSSLSRSVRPFVHSYTHNMVRTETEMLWQNRQKNKDPRKTRSRARSAWFFKDIIIH